MALDPRIILGGQTPDIIGAMGRGNALAQQTMDMRQQNALNALYREQGAGIASGDDNALNALAAFDPMQAANLRTQNANNQRAEEQMQWQRQRAERQDSRADQEWQFKVQEYRNSISQQQAETEAAQIEDSVKVGLALPDATAWDAYMTQNAPDLVGQFDQREALAQRYMSIADIMRGGSGEYGLTPVYGSDDQGNTVVMQIGKDGSAVRTQLPEGVTGVDLGVKSRESARGTTIGKAQGEAQMDLPGAITKADRAISNLEAIRDDPALPSITGMVQGRIPPLSQSGTDLNTRIQQAQGQAFLEAFESLKGGGQITEIEGQKAEAAMARLDRAQSTEAYQSALNELIDVLRVGVDRAKGRAGIVSEPQRGGGDTSDDDLLRKYGG